MKAFRPTRIYHLYITSKYLSLHYILAIKSIPQLSRAVFLIMLVSFDNS